MSEGQVRVDDFQGKATDIAPGKLPPFLFQRDEGSDLFLRGGWRRRRGQARLAIAPGSGAIETLFTFETPAGATATIVIDAAGLFRGFAYLADNGEPVAEPVLTTAEPLRRGGRPLRSRRGGLLRTRAGGLLRSGG